MQDSFSKLQEIRLEIKVKNSDKNQSWKHDYIQDPEPAILHDGRTGFRLVIV